MAYATGTGATITDLLDALRSFAVGQGWTIDKWDSVNKLLFLSKGVCAVTIQTDTTITRTEWTGSNGGGVSSVQPDHYIRMALNTSNNPALTTFWGHPGSVVTSVGDSDQINVNGLQGPFVAWHFFADATVGDHIHCVVQNTAETYMHFSFGHVDKKGLTHSGVAYCTGQWNAYWRNVNTYNPSGSGAMNRPSWMNYPFGYTGSSGANGAANGAAPLLLRNTDAWPVAWNGPVAGANGVAPHSGLAIPMVGQYQNPNEYPNSNNGANRLLDMVVMAEALPFSNIVPLFPVPCFRAYYNSVDPTLARICYLGDFPNVRLCNMINMTPGQEITLGADTWKVFPAMRQEHWAQVGIGDKPSTGQYAVAYKKV